MLVLVGLWVSFFTFQTAEEFDTPAPPTTNSGEVFQDPFAGEPDPAPVEEALPVEESSPPIEPTPPTESFPDPFSGPESVPAAPLQESPSIAAPPVEVAPPPPPVLPSPEPAPSISAPENAFEFPDFEKPEGPISEEVGRRAVVVSGTPVGTWHWGLRVGSGLNINRRPAQMSFEAEIGYRFWENIDLNLLTNYRFVKDRILGTIFLPTYTFRLSGSNLNRFDLRVGLGTGWIFRGVTGSGFQYGYIPLRTDLQLIYYAMPRFGMLLGGGTESLLFRWSTNREYFNEFSDPNGPPSQGLLHAGFLWEF